MAVCVFTQDDFLELWRSLLPPDYTVPIETEDEGAGMDLPAMQAQIFARVEVAFNRSAQAMYLRPHSTQSGPSAAFGKKAAGQIEVYRAAPALGELQVRAGQFLIAEATDSLGGVLFLGRVQATETVPIPEGSGGPTLVPVEAEFPGYDGDQVAGVVTRFEPEGRLTVPAELTGVASALRSVTPLLDGRTDRFHAALVGRYVRFVGTLASANAGVPRRVTSVFESGGQPGIEFTPGLDDAGDVGAVVDVEVEELEDFGVTVKQPEPITGGVTDTLRALGNDRATEPVTDETEALFRTRVAELPDVVSPAAIERLCARFLDPVGVTWCLHETRDVDGLMGFTWDIHPWDAPFGLCSCNFEKPPGSELIGTTIVWLSPNMMRRFFMVCVGPTAVDHVPVVSALWHEINQARAAGVAFVIALEGS